MKELVVLSGKGGTGKTSIVGCFAALAESKVLADCDVDAADLHLLLDSHIKETEEFWSGQTASIDESLCTKCNLCEEHCRFEAIKDFKVDPVSCEGCRLCYELCPSHAIRINPSLCGHSFISDTPYGLLVHAKLGIAKENSGKLVQLVRQNAKRIATEMDFHFIITDGPPGIGCPVISSLSGANLALLVTEPTLSGIHDLERVMSVCKHFKVPALVCINKCDLNLENTARIEAYCQKEGVQVAAKIPFETKVIEALVQGKPVVNTFRSDFSEKIKALWQMVKQTINA